ncbi:MAG: undecaprenyldiphospho-muramoylpentapeptide beta-N-acetylglucosaminyltransferase [Candidatus Omnitrophica bacterium]|nr:undecaprenyldiphospho-muramoylpentapeptide beta-N-acetylglucosaminyltransferase [Candidatus Omnitrophota bacterium]MDD5352792.1 undecaprenyldiphospho-muramoylpentapeptide beta-N-acetylglucosaminyltransferase [Candidatus Omnitrophota bacterium]MDD5550391.1 undecaprenyldiphospho-muramoylpentapeptide beta-N-acetylglucosaminyltransferase [Candidatus Omnitrophota bacterium]
MKVLVIASHSGGHILPAIAFCQGLQGRDNRVEINFIATDGEIERKLLGNNFNPIFFRRKKITILSSFSLIKLFFQAHRLIKRTSPDLIVGFGGYLSIPFIICAYFKRIPNFIHEQNMRIGLANLFLMNFSDKIIFSFPNTKISDKLKNKALFLGIPLRKEMVRIDRQQARRYFGLDDEKFTLLVTGGSQGSLKINTQIIEVLKEKEFSDIQVIHIAGLFDYERVAEEYKKLNIKSKVFSLFDHMNYAFCACDLAICRAGAGTIAEIAAFRIPSILIPYPYAKLHQLDNARFLVDKGAAVLLEDKFLCKPILKEVITSLKNNPDRLKQLSESLGNIDNLDARDRMAELALTLAQCNYSR